MLLPYRSFELFNYIDLNYLQCSFNCTVYIKAGTFQILNTISNAEIDNPICYVMKDHTFNCNLWVLHSIVIYEQIEVGCDVNPDLWSYSYKLSHPEDLPRTNIPGNLGP
jgi:hypothetical protein